MKTRLMIIIAASALAFPLIIFGGIPVAPMKVTKTGNSKPAVLFDHNKHSSVTDCKGCHSAAKDRLLAHKKCKGCHQGQGGPVACDACHKG